MIRANWIQNDITEIELKLFAPGSEEDASTMEDLCKLIYVQY